jgi:hypothetical protein
MNVSKFFLGLVLVMNGEANAACYLGASDWQFHLMTAKTNVEDRILRSDVVVGSMKKDLTSSTVETRLGCFIPGYDWIAVEVGYIPNIVVSTEADIALSVLGYTTPSIRVTREARVSAMRYSALFYTGGERSFIRGFFEVDYLQAKGKGEGGVHYGKYFIGVDEYRKAHGFTPSVGMTFRISDNTSFVGKYHIFGPKAHAFAFGVNVSF